MSNMSPRLQVIVDHVEHVLRTAECGKYSEIDRLGILRYRKLDSAKHIPFSTSSALRTHLLAIKTPETLLSNPIQVFCPDNLKDTHVEDNLDLRIALRLKLGYFVETYEELVRWYISFS